MIPSNKKLPSNILKEYKTYIQYQLTFLNLDKCNLYFFNFKEFDTKKELNKSLLSCSTYSTSFNNTTKKYNHIYLDKQLIITRDWKNIKSQFFNFIKLYNLSNSNLDNFKVNRDTWTKASSTWDIARNDHLIAYLKYQMVDVRESSKKGK